MRKPCRAPVLYSLAAAAMLISVRCPAEVEPAAKAIFEAYAEALGGEEAYAGIDTAQMGMTIEMPTIGMSMVREVSYKQPNKIFAEMDIQGMGKMRQGYDGEKGWSVDPIQGSRELVGPELEKLLSETDFKEGINLVDKYASARIAGKDEEGLVILECVTAEGGHPEKLYFDSQTGLLEKMETIEDMGPQGEVPVSARVVAYGKMGDLLMPVHIDAQMLGMSMIMKVTRFEPNVPVDESLFSMPE